SDLPVFLNQFDIGLFLLEPTNFNYLHALPNKLFEFIQARLAIAIGPSPEMARIVRESKLGVVSADFRPESLAHLLNALTADDINRFKEQAHASASRYCSERNKELLRDLCGELLDRPRLARAG